MAGSLTFSWEDGMRIRGRAGVWTVVGWVALALPVAAAASDARAVGGGVVDGPLGLTSQLGFGATSDGGSFQCVMAGRSRGFPFGPWKEVLQMEVHGDVTPGSLVINADGSATFTGKARVQVVGRDANGKILKGVFPGADYSTTHEAGGPGEATHLLQVLGLTFGPAPLKAGHISITP